MLCRWLSLLTCALTTCACGFVEFPEPTRASLIPVAGTGGSTSASGSTTAGGSTGTGGAAGTSGAGGAAGTSGAGGSTDPLSCGHDELGPFPATGYLDHFDRADGPVGSNWASNSTAGYTLSNGVLSGPNGGGYNPTLYWASKFGGGGEELYATFASFDPELYSMSLVMRANATDDTCDNLSVSYANDFNGSPTVSVGYCANSSSTLVLAETALLEPPFVLGVRDFSDGCVEVYVNGVRRYKADASGFPQAGFPGYVGVTAVPAKNATASTIIPRWDDFGGGTL